MDFASSTRATRTRWKGIVLKSSVVPQGPCKVRGVRRFWILGGQGLEYWGGGLISTSCAHKVFNKSVRNNYISHLKI